MPTQFAVCSLNTVSGTPLSQAARQPVVGRFVSPCRAVDVLSYRGRHKSGLVIGLLAILMVGLIVVDTYRAGRAMTEPASSIESSDSAAASERGGSPQLAAEFTETYANGLPVYRLPPIQVTAVRNPDLLRGASEE